MATIVMEKLGRVFISLQQIRQVPQMLTDAVPSMPATVRDLDVPSYFRERYICAGYRPLHQNWRYYFLSMFQRHNETINIWSHLLAFLVILAKLHELTETVDFVGDHHSWPLLILILSSLIYTACSVAAHLLGSKSELCHIAFYFLDYVGVAQYQYGSAVVHYYYAVDHSLHKHLQGLFMPVAVLLSCVSCLGCCFGKYHSGSLHLWLCKVCQVVPSVLAFFWDSCPLIMRLLSWSSADPAIIYHFSQVAFFFSSAFFFTFPLPECCFPGQCDFFGHSHQIFHVLLSCCTLCQIHSYQIDYTVRRELYSHLHRSHEAAVFVGLYVMTLVACLVIALFVLRKVKLALDIKAKFK
ncbi:membrane progestin receptor alpha-B-like [Gouania willdenowi]|uniref:Membrane progestin receptor alpha-B-like n=1 Tax=Gouania willdenowi TaxID=441366 RepID=A0A8C5EUG3_GOUWI|nr:membrane progestin receptor alpha-B-like [Gouania willdenowi]XP_028317140.1 membrane progestin receptor alpha-B-like [Gouania willdenowi]XP_028317141.1 membrane progestin receptor alpha-B-like [Gouania willdenowi]XP_028317142.1 membrane progestin receptor alpha-B-like [Gouania willdenowi]XP_028317143.1 membrane progestin receptor alpha-B-like [Gouania willdenowi]